MEYNIEKEYITDIKEIKRDLLSYKKIRQKMVDLIAGIPYQDINAFVVAFRTFLNYVEYRNIHLVNNKSQKAILAINENGEQEYYVFIEKKNALSIKEIKTIQTTIKRYLPVNVFICFAGSNDDISDQLYDQRDEYNFEIIDYDQLKEEIEAVKEIYENIILVQQEIIDKLKELKVPSAADNAVSRGNRPRIIN